MTELQQQAINWDIGSGLVLILMSILAQIVCHAAGKAKPKEKKHYEFAGSIWWWIMCWFIYDTIRTYATPLVFLHNEGML